MFEACTCTHSRDEHADHVNPLQVVRLHATEADEDRNETHASATVRGAGHCKVVGCTCKQFHAMF